MMKVVILQVGICCLALVPYMLEREGKRSRVCGICLLAKRANNDQGPVWQ